MDDNRKYENIERFTVHRSEFRVQSSVEFEVDRGLLRRNYTETSCSDDGPSDIAIFQISIDAVCVRYLF